MSNTGLYNEDNYEAARSCDHADIRIDHGAFMYKRIME